LAIKNWCYFSASFIFKAANFDLCATAFMEFLLFYKICIAALAFSIIFVSGCANKPDRGNKSSQIFETDITDDGSKRFTLSIVEAKREGGKGKGSKQSGKGQRGEGGNGRGGKGQGGQRGGRGGESENGDDRGNAQSYSSNEDNREKTIALLEAKLTETGYCRNGYIELDYSFVPGKTEFRGECQESASDADKAKW
jgi:hypothetical protein